MTKFSTRPIILLNCGSIVLFFLLLTTGCGKRSNRNTWYGFKSDTLNFGQINQRDTFKERVFCYNNSDQPIKVINIESSCGCTKSSITDSIIDSNDSIPILVQYIPLHSNDSGKVLRFITLRTNSNPAFVNLKVKGEVIK